MKNHKYLKRLTFVILFVVFIPVILVFIFFWGRSSDELEKGNRIYYEKIAASFANDFWEKLEEMKLHAAKIIVDSKKSTSAFWEGSEKFKEHLYWYYDAVQEMKEEYFYYNTSKCGVYYYDTDFIITEDGTMTSERFLNYDLQADGEAQEIWDFLMNRIIKWASGFLPLLLRRHKKQGICWPVIVRSLGKTGITS